MDSTLAAGLVGAAAALVVGLGGALIANLPAWSLEKRQARKESRDELRQLLAGFAAGCMQMARNWEQQGGNERAETALQLLSTSAQIRIVLRPDEDGVRDFVDISVRLLVMSSENFSEANRFAVAFTVWNQLPEWYRGTVSIRDLQEASDQFRAVKRAVDGGANVNINIHGSEDD